MSMRPITHEFLKVAIHATVISILTLCLASCSTSRGIHDHPEGATATKSSTEKDRAAERRRWATRVQRDNELQIGRDDRSGSR
jgi:hypothetical protein